VERQGFGGRRSAAAGHAVPVCAAVLQGGCRPKRNLGGADCQPLATSRRTGCGVTGRLLPPGLHRYGDVRRGDWVETGGVQVTADLIDRFADLTGDRFAIHMSDQAARDLGFTSRVAHGLLVLALVDGLKNQCPAQFDAVASLGWEWDFLRPVVVGDTLRATLTVKGRRKTGKPTRGILRLEVVVIRGAGEVVQSGRNLLMVRREPKP